LASRPELFAVIRCLSKEVLARPILYWETTAMAFSRNGTSGGDSLSSEINVTPLIDVLLVMLIIFMVIVPVMPRGLNSTLPSVATSDVVDEAGDHPILVEVEQSQTAVRYLIEGAGVERAEITPRLRELLSRRPVGQVLLRADAKLDFGVIAGVIDAGQAAGAKSIGLLTPKVAPTPR
jgi:biopolymer transport protein TolR